MKPITTHLVSLVLITCLQQRAVSEETTSPAMGKNNKAKQMNSLLAYRKTPVQIVVVSDETGGPKLRESGVEPVASNDLEKLCDGVVNLNQKVELTLACVDGKTGNDDILVKSLHQTINASPPARINLQGMTQRDRMIVMRKWRRERLGFHEKFLGIQKRRQKTTASFLAGSDQLLIDQASEFDKEMVKRGVSDFPRSDMRLIPLLSKQMNKDSLKIWILSTDGVDQVEGRPSRTKPFDQTEIAKDVIIYTTCDTLENNPLFRNVKHQIRLVSSIEEAVKKTLELIRKSNTRKE